MADDNGPKMRQHLYVAGGSDAVDADGARDKPYATAAPALEAVRAGGTIYVRGFPVASITPPPGVGISEW